MEARCFLQKERYLEPALQAYLETASDIERAAFSFTLGHDSLHSLTLKANGEAIVSSKTPHTLPPRPSSSLSFNHLVTTKCKKVDIMSNSQGQEDESRDELKATHVILKDREIASMQKAAERSGSGSGSDKRPASAKKQPSASPTISTTTAAFNLRTEYPELFQQAINNTKSRPAPNKTFVSDWGDSLKQAVDPVWREINMKSTYTASNDQLNGPRGSLYSDVISEEGLHKWVIKQKTYYGDLLTEDKAKELEAKFQEGNLEEKRVILGTLRTLAAVSRPDLDKSHSQAEHCLMAKTDDPELNAMMKEQTRVKTFGNPTRMVHTSDLPAIGEPFPSSDGTAPKVPVQAASFAFTLRPTEKDQGEGAALMLGMLPLGRVARTSSRPMSAAPPVRREGRDEMKDKAFLTIDGKKAAVRPQTARAADRKSLISTFKSNVPLEWAPGLPIPQSSNTAAFSKPKAFRQYGAYAIDDRFTSPYGATNKNTTVIPQKRVIPVPHGMIQRIETEIDQSTIHRSSFQIPSKAEQARHLKDAIKANQQARALSYTDKVPLDRNALATSFSKDWQSAMTGLFPAPDAEASLARIRADRKRAAEVQSIFNGPTAL